MFELLSVPAIIAFVEAAKMSGLPVKFAAAVSIVAGLGVGYLSGSLLEGMVLGLAASGLYSGVKATLKE